MRPRVYLLAGVIAFAAIITGTGPSYGQTIGYPGTQIDQRCRPVKWGLDCTTVIGPREWPSAKIIAVPPPANAQAQAESDAREAEWLAICKPTILRDKYGVSRYQYDKACPFGVVTGPAPLPAR